MMVFIKIYFILFTEMLHAHYFLKYYYRNTQYDSDITVNILHRLAAAAKSLQSCLTLCDPIDGSPPGSPVPGILQAGNLTLRQKSYC